MMIMSLERPTIVLFDMDGTTVRHVNPKLLGLLEFLDDTSFKLGRFLKRDRNKPVSTDEKPGRTTSLLVHRAIHKFRKKPVEQIVQPCPGIFTVLNLIKHSGIPLGVVSNGLGKGYGDDILEKLNLDQFFKTAIFREDFKKSKPHPDPLLRALKDLKHPLGEEDVVWYIGDRHKDVVAAFAADERLPCKVIPFAYGLNASVAVLEKGLGPDHIIMNYHDFAGTIRDVLGKKSDGAEEEFDVKEELEIPAPFNDNNPLSVA